MRLVFLATGIALYAQQLERSRVHRRSLRGLFEGRRLRAGLHLAGISAPHGERC